MRDQTVSWNPRKLHPDIVKPAGPIDPDVGVLVLETPQAKPVAAYVNFAMHPDTVGGEGISADYPGVLSRLLAECKGPEMVTLFANGCCGNLNHRHVGWADAQKGPQEARRIGTVLAGTVCKTIPLLRPVPAGRLGVRSEIVKLPLAPITPEDVARAKEVVGRLREPKTTFLEKVKAFQVLDVAAREGKPLEVEVQVVALGDQVAWVSLPGEIFVELGLALKKASPFPHTLIAELANGSVGYIPDRPAYPQGNYEVVSARCAAGSGELLVETALRLLGAGQPASPGARARKVREVIAHRGGTVDRPENTLASCRRAIEVGATVTETDIRTTRDGALICMHDADVSRTTNGKGPVSEKTLAELRELDAGSWFNPTFKGERIPTLRETLELCKGKIDVMLDLKEQGESYAKKVAAEVRKHGDPRRTVLGIRSVEQARQLRQLLPEARQVGLIPTPEALEAFAEAGVPMIRLWPRWLTDGALVPRLRKLGLTLHLGAGMGSKDEVLPLLAYEPESLSSDDPARLLRTLAQIAAEGKTEERPR
jgi:glycerophosphoryl diester phosphodiesterase